MSRPLEPLPPTFAGTVAALHRIAEQVVAPARKPDNEIALAATPGGFGTPVFEHAGLRRQVRVDGAELVVVSGDAEERTPLTTVDAARALVGDLIVAPGPPDREPLRIDPEAAARLADWYTLGAAVLEQLVATGFRGAELSYAELLGAPDPRAAALDFLTTRKDALA